MTEQMAGLNPERLHFSWFLPNLLQPPRFPVLQAHLMTLVRSLHQGSRKGRGQDTLRICFYLLLLPLFDIYEPNLSIYSVLG